MLEKCEDELFYNKITYLLRRPCIRTGTAHSLERIDFTSGILKKKNHQQFHGIPPVRLLTFP